MRETRWLLPVLCVAWLALGGMIGWLVGWTFGLARGKELARMEPPRVGLLHFRDGWIQTVHAESPSEAIDQLVSGAGR